MSEQTNIAWADSTASPFYGCSMVSPGCVNCYIIHTPILRSRGYKHGDPRIKSKSFDDNCRKWNKRLTCDCGTVQIDLADTRTAACPKCESAYRKRRVFPSLCDWLDPEVPIEWLAEFLNIIHDCQNIDFLLLTKRPEFWPIRLDHAIPSMECGRTWAAGWMHGEPPNNVWFGVTCEDQKRADERIPLLFKIPAKVRFLSCEPLLEKIDLRFGSSWTGAPNLQRPRASSIHWVISGGESGHHARPCHIDWIRDIRDQCKAAGVACFVKQVGSNPHCDCGELPSSGYTTMQHPKGADPAEWPEDLRVQDFPIQ